MSYKENSEIVASRVYLLSGSGLIIALLFFEATILIEILAMFYVLVSAVMLVSPDDSI